MQMKFRSSLMITNIFLRKAIEVADVQPNDEWDKLSLHAIPSMSEFFTGMIHDRAFKYGIPTGCAVYTVILFISLLAQVDTADLQTLALLLSLTVLYVDIYLWFAYMTFCKTREIRKEYPTTLSGFLGLPYVFGVMIGCLATMICEVILCICGINTKADMSIWVAIFIISTSISIMLVFSLIVLDKSKQ